MDADLLLVVGLAIGVLAVPAVVSAFSDGRVPRAGSIMVMVSIGLLVSALANKPGGYRVGDIPDAVFSVLGRYVW
jgi:hypothetical protein